MIRAHGVETFPDECCGALIEVGGVIVEAFRLPNTTSSGAARRFRISPERLPDGRSQGVGVEGGPRRLLSFASGPSGRAVAVRPRARVAEFQLRDRFSQRGRPRRHHRAGI